MVRKRDLKEVLEERRGETQIACYVIRLLSDSTYGTILSKAGVGLTLAVGLTFSSQKSLN